MVRGSAVTLCLVMFLSLLAFPVFGQSRTVDIQSKVLERFDDPTGAGDDARYEYRQNHRWIVRGSKFITEGSPRFSWVRAFANAAFPMPPQNLELRSLGVQAAFDRSGQYNFLEIIPVEDEDDESGNPVEKGIQIPGRVQSLDLWVWGTNYRYYLEVQLRDYRGMVHSIKVGDLTFVGWKNLRVEIPRGIPQDVRHAPTRRGLELVKFVVWTYPDEKVDGFTVYLDHVKVNTDMFEQPYDGSNLTNETAVQELWSQGVGTFAPATN